MAEDLIQLPWYTQCDWDKSIVRRDGCLVRVICRDLKSHGNLDQVVVAIREDIYRNEVAEVYHPSGMHFGNLVRYSDEPCKEHPHDIINVE